MLRWQLRRIPAPVARRTRWVIPTTLRCQMRNRVMATDGHSKGGMAHLWLLDTHGVGPGGGGFAEPHVPGRIDGKAADPVAVRRIQAVRLRSCFPGSFAAAMGRVLPAVESVRNPAEDHRVHSVGGLTPEVSCRRVRQERMRSMPILESLLSFNDR